MREGNEPPPQKEREKKIMATITFDKGIITYTDNENNYNYSIDINNGIIMNNRTNRKNKSLPPKFINACANLMSKCWADKENIKDYHLSNIIFYFYMRSKGYSFYQLRIIDKLSAIGMYITTLPTDYIVVEKNMARIAKHHKNFPDSTLQNILYEIQQEDIEKTIKSYCSPDSPYYDYFRCQYKQFSNNKLSFVTYFLAHGLWDFYVQGTVDITSSWRKNDIYTNITNTLTSYFSMCDYFKKPYEKSDFFKQFVALSKTYKIEQIMIESNTLKDFYSRYANKISFENNDFEVILPTCREDFKKEADSQHNCVYTTYFPKVIKNETIVVFIRRKAEIAKSYITCEINIITGQIKQYLAIYNHQVTDENAINFKKDYQTFLLANF